MGIGSHQRRRKRRVPAAGETGAWGFAAVILLSLAMHGLLLGGMMFFHDFDFLKPKPRVVRVDLVSFVPGPVGGASEPPPQTSVTPESAEAQPEPPAETVPPKPAEPAPEALPDRPVLKPDLSLKSKPKDLDEMKIAKAAPKPPELKKRARHLKSKTRMDPEKKLEKARQELAEQVESQRREQISKALDRMRQAIAGQETNAQASVPGKGAGAGAGFGKQGSDPILLYQMVLKSAIEQNWVFNDALARMDQGLEVRLLIKILKSGEIRDITYDTRSGNRYLDESAKKAIQRAGPLPELPKGMRSYDVVVGFTPKGLR